MKIKYLIVIGIFVLLIGVGLILYDFPKRINCDSYGAIYLKASELDKASQIADNQNVIVVIPELNQIIGRTELLECDSFEYSRYVNMEGYVE